MPPRQPAGPPRQNPLQRRRQLRPQPRHHLIRPRQAPLQQRRPPGRPQRIRPLRLIPGARHVQPRQRRAQRPAMLHSHPPRPHTRQKRRDTRRAPRQLPAGSPHLAPAPAAGTKSPAPPDAPSAPETRAAPPGPPAAHTASGCNPRSWSGAGSCCSQPPPQCPGTQPPTPAHTRSETPPAPRRQPRYRPPPLRRSRGPQAAPAA